MILVTQPEYWSSVHRPIEFLYDYEARQLYASDNSGGKLRVYISPTFSYTPVAGDKIYITGILADANAVTNYNDQQHTVVSVSGNMILTDTDYSGDITSGSVNVSYIRLPQIKLYSGYLPAEEYPTELPLTLVATFTPENSPDNNIQFDVSEYLKSIFRIVAPVEGIDFNMFNRYRLYFDGAYQDFFMVLNSSILTSELNELYVDTGAYLNSKIPPIAFGCGKTILSTLQGSVVVNRVLEGVPDGGDFNNDFNDDFNIE